MSLFQNYKIRQEQLLAMIGSLKDFEQSDKSVGFVFNVARSILAKPTDFQDVSWLVRKGSELIAYYGYLEGTANVKSAQYKVSEVANKDVRNGLMISLKNDNVTLTEARAHADRETTESEVDVIKQELEAKNYATAAKIAERITGFIQSTLKSKESESRQAQSRLTDQGIPR